MRRIFPIGARRRTPPSPVAESPADAEAAAWIARLDRSGADEHDQPALQRWLEADIRHRGAFLRARAMWRMMDGEAAAEPLPLPAPPALMTRRALVAGVAATAVGAGALLALNWPQPAQATVLRTGFGEIRRFTLSGGGRLILDGQSAIALRQGDIPEIDLLHGGAWIDLPERTLSLNMLDGGLRLDASSAALALRRSPLPEVIVARGFVDLLHGAGQATRLGAGARARRGRDEITRIDQLPPDRLDRLLAWRTGDIDLDGETVAVAAGRFNLYNRRRIVVADAHLAAERVVGRFALHRPEDFAEAVAGLYGGRIRRDDGSLRIERPK